jgi:hypothetical protein
MAKNIFQVLEGELRAKIAQAQDFLGSGSAKDFAEYRETCGLIRGLETALREVKDLAKNFMEDDDD